jgi:ADP-heptose:LPS heptosyltransferase
MFMTEDLILYMGLSPGDTCVMTAAVRDLHLAYPGRFRTDVRCVAEELFDNNPYLDDLDENDVSLRKAEIFWRNKPDTVIFNDIDAGIMHIKMNYDMIHQSNTGAVHFLHGFICHLERTLGLRIPVTQFKGDIHLTEEEKRVPLSMVWDRDFWIIMAGGKYDITAKWWDPERWQELVDMFAGCIQFVQCGEKGHFHEPLRGVIDLRGKTSTRDFVRLMHHAAGVVCPVTFAMHLAAAVPTRSGRFRNRPCVVIAGGREPLQWVQYPHHRVLATNGALPCCDQGGCWKSKCDRIRPDDDRGDICLQPTLTRNAIYIPKCMAMIGVDDVARAIDQYFRGGVVRYLK